MKVDNQCCVVVCLSNITDPFIRSVYYDIYICRILPPKIFLKRINLIRKGNFNIRVKHKSSTPWTSCVLYRTCFYYIVTRLLICNSMKIPNRFSMKSWHWVIALSVLPPVARIRNTKTSASVASLDKRTNDIIMNMVYHCIFVWSFTALHYTKYQRRLFITNSPNKSRNVWIDRFDIPTNILSTYRLLVCI